MTTTKDDLYHYRNMAAACAVDEALSEPYSGDPERRLLFAALSMLGADGRAKLAEKVESDRAHFARVTDDDEPTTYQVDRDTHNRWYSTHVNVCAALEHDRVAVFRDFGKPEPGCAHCGAPSGQDCLDDCAAADIGSVDFDLTTGENR